MAKAVITKLAPKPNTDTHGLFQKAALQVLAAVKKVTKPKFREPDPWFMPPAALDNTQRLLMRQRHAQNDYRQHPTPQHQTFHSATAQHLSPRF